MTAKTYPFPIKLALAAEALLALAHARVILHRTRPEDVLARNRAALRHDSGTTAGAGSAAIAFVIPRLAPRLPWRSDCLVQALAGQMMLSRRRITSEIVIGTAKQQDGSFEAHAWLTCEGSVILGGDVARFVPLLDSRGDGPGAA